MTKQKIAEALLNVGELPPMPQVASQVLQIIEKSDFSFADLVSVISKDVSITTAILKLANSPLFGIKVSVNNLTQAISLLGIKNLKNLVVALSTKGLFEASKITIFEHKLWEHSVATAIYARLFAVKFHRSIAEEAFIVGLIHDIGQILLSMYFDKYSIVKEMVYGQDVDIISVEREYLGFDHADVGGYLLEQWGLPELYIDVVSFHHDIKKSKYNDMARLLHIANNKAKIFGYGITAGCEKGFEEDFGSYLYPEDDVKDLDTYFVDIIKSEKELFKL